MTEASGTPGDQRDWLAYPRSLVAPIYGHLGFAITDGGEGWLEITLDVGDVVLNADGVVHGGVWLVIADSAMGGAVRTLLEPHERAVTGQLDFRWLRPFGGRTLRAIGRVTRRGRALTHCSVELLDETDRLVGSGTSTFDLRRHREGRQPGVRPPRGRWRLGPRAKRTRSSRARPLQGAPCLRARVPTPTLNAPDHAPAALPPRALPGMDLTVTKAGEQPQSRPKPAIDRKARLSIPARRPSKRPAHERLGDWDEVYFLFDADTAKAEAMRCIQCPAAPCQKACPVHNDIPGSLWLLEQGEFAAAAEVFRETSELPEFCGRLCPQERLCEGHCVVGKHALPVAIGKLETFVTEWEHGDGRVDLAKDTPTGRRIAVVGSGPAGIGCAERLARAGHAVTMFEQWPEPGGILLYGIPTFKQNKAAVERKFQQLHKLGIEVITGMTVGVDLPYEQLRGDFDAVFLAYGAMEGARLRISGEDATGVFEATEFLVRANLEGDALPDNLREPLPSLHNVVVVGGGDTSMDCVRSSRRLGAENTTLIYRRTEREMQGRSEERQHATEEGVRFEYLTAPLEVLTDSDGHVRALRCQRMRLGQPDDTGRARPEPEPGSEFEIEADAIVIAIGYNVDPFWSDAAPEVMRDRWNRVVVDPETMHTNIEGVFAGGDNVNGADLVVTALADGHKAADAIHAYLGGLASP